VSLRSASKTSTRIRRRRARSEPRSWWRFSAALLPFLLASPLLAHELGAVRVVARFHRNGTWAVDCIIDREHLSQAFAEAASYPPRAGPIRGLRPSDEATLGRLLARVADAVHVEFDGVDARPALAWIGRDPAAAETTLRLTGATPAGAVMFAFTNDARIGTYLLSVYTEGEPQPERRWQTGGEGSDGVMLRSQVVPKPGDASSFGQVLSVGAVVVVAALLLRAMWRAHRRNPGSTTFV
jgi:hypothetical protein